MDDEKPQEFEDETANDSQLAEELDRVFSDAASLVETLADEVGTPEEVEATPPPDPSKSDLESEEPDFMAELTQSEPPSPSGTEPEPSHLGAGSSTVASPEKLGVVASANVSAIGTAATATQNDPLEEELKAIEAAQAAEENDEIATGDRNRIVPRVLSILGSFGVWLVALIAPLLDVLDRPTRGLSQPIRHAMGILAIATLATAMVVFAFSFW